MGVQWGMSIPLLVSTALAAWLAAGTQQTAPPAAPSRPAAPAPTSAPSSVPLPQGAAADAPSLQRFHAWLEAFNSADRAKLAQFVETQAPGRASRIDQDLDFSRRTGGFTLRKIVEVTPARTVAFVEEREGENFVQITFDVDPAAPHAMTQFEPRIVPRPPEFAIPRLTEAQLAPALRAAAERAAASDRFSGAIAVAKKDAMIYTGAFGMADREKPVANTPDTRFRNGSMNKMITAVAVLQLAQAGKLKLTDPIGTYLTDYPNKDLASKVTVHHLLTHTGGTGDIFTPEYAARRLEMKTHADYLALYGQRGVAFEPGSRFAYSNYGFVLLGAIVERVSGGSYYDYVREHVYVPAGMASTGSQPEEEAVPGRAIGYTRPPGATAWTPNTGTLPYRGTSAGGGYTTAGDLVRFANAILSHKLLNAEHTTLLLTGKAEMVGGGPPGNRYAYGFMDGTDDGRRVVGHGGGAPGQNGELAIYPDSGYIIVVLANLDPPAAGRLAQFVKNRLPK